MSKLILCFVLLFNIYICEEIKQVRTFEEKDAGKELHIRLGEEFAIKTKGAVLGTVYWGFTNEEETKEFVQYLRRNYVNHYHYHYFKAIKVTNGPLSLKFSRLSNFFSIVNPTTITFKINVK